MRAAPFLLDAGARRRLRARERAAAIADGSSPCPLPSRRCRQQHRNRCDRPSAAAYRGAGLARRPSDAGFLSPCQPVAQRGVLPKRIDTPYEGSVSGIGSIRAGSRRWWAAHRRAMRNFWRWPLPPRSRCPTKSNIAGTGAATESFSASAISPAKSKGASCPLPSRRRKASDPEMVHCEAERSETVSRLAKRSDSDISVTGMRRFSVYRAKTAVIQLAFIAPSLQITPSRRRPGPIVQPAWGCPMGDGRRIKLRRLWKHGSRPAPGWREKVIAES